VASLSDLTGAYGVYSNLSRGGAVGDARAATGSAKLATSAGAFGGKTGALNSVAGDANNLLSIYTGLKQGGVGGYGGAAVNAAQLGSKLGAFGNYSSAVGTAAGYAAAPLALYNEVKNWQSGNTGSDALGGASTGAAIGSIVPGIGTVVGGLVGGAVGALSSAFGPGKTDPETNNWSSFLTANNKQPGLASQVSNPYGLIAGVFDEHGGSSVPMVQKYGRMGEQKFTNDMATTINSALAKGVISKTDSPQTVYQKVVLPWTNSMGTGWKNVGPEYTNAIQGLLQQMTTQYVSGQAQSQWKAIGGDNPFKNLPKYGGGTTSLPTTATAPQNQPAKPNLTAIPSAQASQRPTATQGGSSAQLIAAMEALGMKTFAPYMKAA
jgi:hypothetical protein